MIGEIEKQKILGHYMYVFKIIIVFKKCQTATFWMILYFQK